MPITSSSLSMDDMREALLEHYKGQLSLDQVQVNRALALIGGHARSFTTFLEGLSNSLKAGIIDSLL